MKEVWTSVDYTLGRCPMELIGRSVDGEDDQNTAPDAPPQEAPITDLSLIKLMDNGHLHAAIQAQAKLAANGDVQAARALVALTERRSKLLGLDAPTKTINVDLTPLHMRDYRELSDRELRALIAEQRSTGQTYDNDAPDEA